MTIADGIDFLVRLGLVDVVLPFILVFTIMLAMLERTRVLGEENGKPRRSLNAMVSLVVGFLTVASLEKVNLLNTLSMISGVGVVMVVVLLMVLGLVGAKAGSKLMIWIGVIICIIGTLILLGQLGVLPSSIADLQTSPIGPIFFCLLAFFLIAYFIIGGKPATATATAPSTSGKKQAKPERSPDMNLQREFNEADLKSPGLKWGH